MLAALAAVIEDLEIPFDGESLEQAIALRDRLDARIVEATGVFEANGIWAGDASVSFVAWLRAHAKMTRRSAQRLRTLAVRLRCLPVCAQAYAEGSLSGGQIEAIVARVDNDNVEIFAAQEAELVRYLIPMTVAGVSRAMGYWLARNQPEPSEPKEPERSLHLSPTLDDRWILNGSLDAEGGSILATALRLATPDKTDLLISPATRRANALVDICRFFLDHQQTHAGGRHRPHVNVVVELKDLEAGRGGQVVDGPTLDGATVSRLFCDSAVHRVVMSGRSAISTTAPPPAPFRRRSGTPS
jgi:5-methylcytosine-specific restriction protein A